MMATETSTCLPGGAAPAHGSPARRDGSWGGRSAVWETWERRSRRLSPITTTTAISISMLRAHGVVRCSRTLDGRFRDTAQTAGLRDSLSARRVLFLDAD